MAIVCTENIDSRQNTDVQSAELLFTIVGTADEAAALASLKATAPATLGGLKRQPVAIEPVHVDTANPGTCIWTGTVNYAPFERQEPPQTGESVFNFDTGGGTQHITQSLQTVARYPSGSAPDFKGAIGVTHDNVEGVDITVPVYTFSETHYLAASQVTNAYKMTLFALTGKINNAAFKGLAAGECLFLGASGSKRGVEDWEITFRFAGSPNRTGLAVGPITGISKKGWEYLWVRYADTEDTASHTLVKQPVAAYGVGRYPLAGGRHGRTVGRRSARQRRPAACLPRGAVAGRRRRWRRIVPGLLDVRRARRRGRRDPGGGR